MCAICWVLNFFRLPEPKGRTYAELDMLFDTKTLARRFKDTFVDPFAMTVVQATEEKKAVTVHVEKVDSNES